jgi:thymine-DNA glycosylase
LHKPKDTHSLPDLYRIGNTNLCARATRAGDGLSKEEQEDGVPIVERKIAEFKPEAVCIVGKGIWEVIYKVKTGKELEKGQFHYGWQDEKLWLGQSNEQTGTEVWRGARTFVSSTTSGLAASTTPAEKLAIWKPLGDWIIGRRSEEGQGAE